MVGTLVEEIRTAGEEAKADVQQATAQIAPLIGLPAEITALALSRQQYNTQFVTSEVVEAQQKIADTFADLKLIPKRLSIKDVVWTPPAKVAGASRQ
ncbi:alkanesulfonate transporter substrate-binding subunit [compost metagenome]